MKIRNKSCSLVFAGVLALGLVARGDDDLGSLFSPSAPPPSAPPALSAAELEKLAAPIALHPDTLIAIILPASTFPLEVVKAARFVRDANNLPKVDDQPWDDSVKAVAKVPELIQKMDEDLSWTMDLGNAYVDQHEELLNAIQSLRAKAQKNGALQNGPQQVVVVTNTVIEKTVENQVIYVTNTVVQIQPSNPTVIYVPTYPTTVYYVPAPPPGPKPPPPLVTFSAGIAVGLIIANNRPPPPPLWYHPRPPVVVGRGPGYRPPPPGYRPPPPGYRPPAPAPRPPGGAPRPPGGAPRPPGGAPYSSGARPPGGAPAGGAARPPGGAPSGGGSRPPGGAPSGGGSRPPGGAPSGGGARPPTQQSAFSKPAGGPSPQSASSRGAYSRGGGGGGGGGRRR